MRQPKRRAKFEKGSITQRVAAYDSHYPGRSAKQLAADEGFNVKSVYSARTANKKKGLPSGKPTSAASSELSLNERDIIAVAKIGLPAVERIVRLLKSLN
jgi:transposase